MFISVLFLDSSRNLKDVILGGVDQDEWKWPKVAVKQGPFKKQ